MKVLVAVAAAAAVALAQPCVDVSTNCWEATMGGQEDYCTDSPSCPTCGDYMAKNCRKTCGQWIEGCGAAPPCVDVSTNCWSATHGGSEDYCTNSAVCPTCGDYMAEQCRKTCGAFIEGCGLPPPLGSRSTMVQCKDFSTNCWAATHGAQEAYCTNSDACPTCGDYMAKECRKTCAAFIEECGGDQCADVSTNCWAATHGASKDYCTNSAVCPTCGDYMAEQCRKTCGAFIEGCGLPPPLASSRSTLVQCQDVSTNCWEATHGAQEDYCTDSDVCPTCGDYMAKNCRKTCAQYIEGCGPTTPCVDVSTNCWSATHGGSKDYCTNSAVCPTCGDYMAEQCRKTCGTFIEGCGLPPPLASSRSTLVQCKDVSTNCWAATHGAQEAYCTNSDICPTCGDYMAKECRKTCAAYIEECGGDQPDQCEDVSTNCWSATHGGSKDYCTNSSVCPTCGDYMAQQCRKTCAAFIEGCGAPKPHPDGKFDDEMAFCYVDNKYYQNPAGSDNRIDRITNIHSMKACMKKCTGDKLCGHVSYQGATKECYMYKKDLGMTTAPVSNAFVSGPSTCRECHTDGYKFAGTPVDTATNVNKLHKCLNKCNKHAECRYVSYEKSTGMCEMYDDIDAEARVAAAGWVTANSDCQESEARSVFLGELATTGAAKGAVAAAALLAVGALGYLAFAKSKTVLKEPLLVEA